MSAFGELPGRLVAPRGAESSTPLFPRSLSMLDSALSPHLGPEKGAKEGREPANVSITE